ncbi:MAG: type VI secretion system tube protein Hcp [Actinobacteria bacterium]|nr:type VI secretion system tube protein Hcp [Actinomycetota bacterium]
MAFDCFMYIEGGNPKAEGETTDAVYEKKKAFEIFSFSWGASNPVSIGSQGGGAGAGKVSISSFNIMKKSDKASSALFLNCCKGTHFDKGTVVLRKAGGDDPVEYIKYEFEELFVESLQWSGSAGGDDYPTESVSFAFAKLNTYYIPQDEKGKGKTPVPASWDLRKNTGK